MDVSVVSAELNFDLWPLVNQSLAGRRRVFIEQKGWALNTWQDIEYDQYDVFGAATYVIVHDAGKIIAGARLLRCDNRIGQGAHVYSYMIRDAYLGLIDLPQGLCHSEPPTDRASWEMTRVFTLDRSMEALRLLIGTVRDYLVSQGAERLLCLGPKSLMRLGSILGFDSKILGDHLGNADGQFLAFEARLRVIPGKPGRQPIQ